ncbi:MAG: amidase family protein [Candidatus Endonucleobacter sp. (ex Gigantidas childressi)]|nr:amidase family protein [Candidatus Endonucleobacter sp. (ex Gigantidas childressi)]
MTFSNGIRRLSNLTHFTFLFSIILGIFICFIAPNSAKAGGNSSKSSDYCLKNESDFLSSEAKYFISTDKPIYGRNLKQQSVMLTIIVETFMRKFCQNQVKNMLGLKTLPLEWDILKRCTGGSADYKEIDSGEASSGNNIDLTPSSVQVQENDTCLSGAGKNISPFIKERMNSFLQELQDGTSSNDAWSKYIESTIKIMRDTIENASRDGHHKDKYKVHTCDVITNINTVSENKDEQSPDVDFLLNSQLTINDLYERDLLLLGSPILVKSEFPQVWGRGNCGLPPKHRDKNGDEGYTKGCAKGPKEDAVLVSYLKQAGAIIFETPQEAMGFGVTGFNSNYRPWCSSLSDLDNKQKASKRIWRILGGSSSPGFWAIDKKICSIILVTDGGSSGRGPGAMLGLPGLKLTRHKGQLGSCFDDKDDSLVAPAIGGGCVADIETAYNVLTLFDSKAPAEKQVLCVPAKAVSDSDTIELLYMDTWANTISEDGVKIKETANRVVDELCVSNNCISKVNARDVTSNDSNHKPYENGVKFINNLKFTFIMHLLAFSLAEDDVKRNNPDIQKLFKQNNPSPALKTQMALAHILAKEICKEGEELDSICKEYRKMLNKHMNDLFTRFPVIVSPTMSIFPPGFTEDEYMKRWKTGLLDIQMSEQIMRFSLIPNMTGCPAITVNIGQNDDGLPIGLHMMAKHGNEKLLIDLAKQIERPLIKKYANEIAKKLHPEFSSKNERVSSYQGYSGRLGPNSSEAGVSEITSMLKNTDVN